MGQQTLYDYLSAKQNYIDFGRLALFVNGYRSNFDVADMWDDYKILDADKGNLGEYSNSNNEVYYNIDFTNYWDGIDKMFLDRLQTTLSGKNAVYADGHMDITTSNHESKYSIGLSKMKFLKSLITSSCVRNDEFANYMKNINIAVDGCLAASSVKLVTNINPVSKALITTACGALQTIWSQIPQNVKDVIKDCKNCAGLESKVQLNVIGNAKGYNDRLANGRIAGQNLLNKINNNEIPSNDTVTIDIIAHSMGYAYAMGMIEKLKTYAKIKFGRFYIIAPENACSGTTDVTSLGFEEVWQYGSNELLDKKSEQDGIAPQCAVRGLSFRILENRYARVPFQGPSILKKFRDAHYISSYKWIFNLIKEQDGYVKKRE